jgi:hypothetical protein
MPKKPNVPYTCPRCGYETLHKAGMEYHLLNKKRPCPILCNEIELTKEVNEYILANRVYKIQQPIPSTVHTINTINNINNYNTINNFISSLDVVEKITKYTTHKQTDTIPFSQSIEDKYSSKAKRLENNTRNIQLKYQDILDIVDDACNGECKIIEEMNFLYDSKLNVIRMFEDGEWQEMIITKGVLCIMKSIKCHYLDSYELYLIRKIKSQSESARMKATYTELIRDYFRIVVCFDLDPFFKNKTNCELLYNEDDPRFFDDDEDSVDAHTIADELWTVFVGIKDKISKTEENSIKKDVTDIIKNNTKRGIEELNKKVLNLFNIDETFKHTLLSRTPGHTL